MNELKDISVTINQIAGYNVFTDEVIFIEELEEKIAPDDWLNGETVLPL